MDKLKMHTPDLANENFRKMSELFPNAVTETITGYDENGRAIVERAIDKEVLQQEISAQVVDGNQERYQFTWPDKRRSIVLANAPIAKTLRLVRERSVGRDGTPGGIDSENIYIEGDNLDVLKLLQETYLGRVKMIYIDPPYNTGSDFVYNDDFSEYYQKYKSRSGQYNDIGMRLVQNPESNGRFHSDWLNMIYPRMRIAKDFLSDDGVIFISIDDNEICNLKKLCDEIFGEHNMFAILTRRSMHTVRNSSKDFNKNTDYVLVYAKNKLSFTAENNNLIREKVNKSDNYPYDDNDGKGKYKLDPIYARNYARPYVHTFTNGIVWEAPQGSYPRYSEEHLHQMELDNELDFNGSQPRAKRYLKKVQDGQPPDTLIREENAGFNLDGTKSLAEALGHEKVFNQPKPVKLISYLISLLKYNEGDVILDFFSGSATTAHAVMQLNAEDGSNRKFIMVQLPEQCEGKSEAYKAGYSTICEIGEERICRVGNKIKEETGADIDCGFRVFRVDSTNMQDVYYRPDEYRQDQMDMLTDNIKPDRTPEDLLIQVMLDLGVLLSSSIEETVIAGKKVFSVADGYLIACFDDGVTEDVVTEIAKRHPFYAVFRDSGLGSDSVAANFEQIFETYSPKTQRKVL